MITPDKLALISCFHCGEPFAHEASIYTISRRYFDNYKVSFVQIHTVDQDVHVPVEINFHESCFREVAGKRYTP